MDDERENLSMKKTLNELANFFLLWILEVTNSYWIILAISKKDIVDAKHNMTQLEDWAWGREIHLG